MALGFRPPSPAPRRAGRRRTHFSCEKNLAGEKLKNILSALAFFYTLRSFCLLPPSTVQHSWHLLRLFSDFTPILCFHPLFLPFRSGRAGASIDGSADGSPSEYRDQSHRIVTVGFSMVLRDAWVMGIAGERRPRRDARDPRRESNVLAR